MTEHVADSPQPWTTPRLEVLPLSATALGNVVIKNNDSGMSYS